MENHSAASDHSAPAPEKRMPIKELFSCRRRPRGPDGRITQFWAAGSESHLSAMNGRKDDISLSNSQTACPTQSIYASLGSNREFLDQQRVPSNREPRSRCRVMRTGEFSNTANTKRIAPPDSLSPENPPLFRNSLGTLYPSFTPGTVQ
jgi:hypothetical protein